MAAPTGGPKDLPDGVGSRFSTMTAEGGDAGVEGSRYDFQNFKTGVDMRPAALFDGFPDGWEVENGFDPVNASSPGEGYSKNEGTGEIDNGEDQGLGTGFLVVLVLVFVGIVAMLVLSQFNFFRGLPGEEDDDLEERRPARERTDGPRKARKDKSDPDKEEKKPGSRRKVVAKRKTN